MEAIETFQRKFDEASIQVMEIIKKTRKSPKFTQVFEQEFNAIVRLESQKRRNIANFYNYFYSIIKKHIKNRDFEKIGYIIQDHPHDLSMLIPQRINSVRQIEETIYPEQSTEMDRINIESLISKVPFKRDPDKTHFLLLCVYARNKDLDYLTVDGQYCLNMSQSLKLIEESGTFHDINLYPIYLTDSYIMSL